MSPMLENDATFKPLRPSNLIHDDVIINDSEYKPIILKEEPGRRPREVFTITQTFADRVYFREALKEFTIIKVLNSNRLN